MSTRVLCLFLVTSIVLCPALAAEEQPVEASCEFVDQLIDKARVGFRELDGGPEEPGDPANAPYRALSLHAPGASECFIKRADDGSHVKCKWKYSRFATDDILEERARGIELQLEQCLSTIAAPRRALFDGQTFAVVYPDLGQVLELRVSPDRSTRSSGVSLWVEFAEPIPDSSNLEAEFPAELGWQRIN